MIPGALRANVQQALDVLHLKMDDWCVHFPPPVDDWDHTLRVCWDCTWAGYYGGGHWCFHRLDPLAAKLLEDDLESWRNVIPIFAQHVVFDCLVTQSPARDFINTARRMYEYGSGKGFLRSYLEYWWDQQKLALRYRWISFRARQRS